MQERQEFLRQRLIRRQGQRQEGTSLASDFASGMIKATRLQRWLAFGLPTRGQIVSNPTKATCVGR